MSTVPWSDCKVAFSIDDPEIDLTELPVPRGWELVEIDSTGARAVAVFRVSGIPCIEDGNDVLLELESFGATGAEEVATP